MKEELDKNKEKLEIASIKSDELGSFTKDIKNIIDNLRKTLIVKNTYTIFEIDKNKIFTESNNALELKVNTFNQ